MAGCLCARSGVLFRWSVEISRCNVFARQRAAPCGLLTNAPPVAPAGIVLLRCMPLLLCLGPVQPVERPDVGPDPARLEPVPHAGHIAARLDAQLLPPVPEDGPFQPSHLFSPPFSSSFARFCLGPWLRRELVKYQVRRRSAAALAALEIFTALMAAPPPASGPWRACSGGPPEVPSWHPPACPPAARRCC